MPQVIRSPEVYDVCIIGSGAAGGTAAMLLAQGGLNVVMLEAGPLLDPRKDFKEHVWPYELEHRGVGPGGKFLNVQVESEFLAPNGAWEIEGEPYTTAPGSDFRWFRSRILGGRTNHYGRISLRNSEWDFKPRSTDGVGDDWPISYRDLAPYYDKTEKFIGSTAPGRRCQYAGWDLPASAETAMHGSDRKESLRPVGNYLRGGPAGRAHTTS